MARPVDPHAKVELLRAAEAVFVEHGLERARVEEITARAGKSKGSFYLHFESKEEAFRQIVETMMARLAGFIEHMDPASCAPEAALDEIMDTWFDREVELFEFLWQNRGLARLMMHGGGGSEYVHLVDAFAERARERTRAWLALGIARGYYRQDLDVEVASLVVSGAYDRIARQLVRFDKKPDIAAWVRGVQRVLLGGLLDPAHPSRSFVHDPPVSQVVAPQQGATASAAAPHASQVRNPRTEPGGVRNRGHRS
jgi:AcrR family transcriptional regulator